MIQNYRISLDHQTKTKLVVKPVSSDQKPNLLAIADITGCSEEDILYAFKDSFAAEITLENLQNDFDAQSRYLMMKKAMKRRGEFVPFWLPKQVSREMRINLRKTNAIRDFIGW